MTNLIVALLFFEPYTNCSIQGVRRYETNGLPIPITWSICNISTNVYAGIDVGDERFVVFLKNIPSTNDYEMEVRSDPNSGTGWRYALTNVMPISVMMTNETGVTNTPPAGTNEVIVLPPTTNAPPVETNLPPLPEGLPQELRLRRTPRK